MKKLFLVVLIVCSTLALAQSGFISSYHPFPNAKKIPVRNCQSNLNSFICPHGRVLVLGAVGAEQQVKLELFGRQFPIRFKNMPSFVSQVWNSDLNADGKADMIVKFNWGGNGIIADGNLTVFALSSNTGYQLSTINSITFHPNALIYLRGKPVILHTALVGVIFPRTKKFAERNHNYWVFHPLEIRGSRLLNNQAPTWVQFTYLPSHVHARLSAKQKASGLKAEPVQIFEAMK